MGLWLGAIQYRLRPASSLFQGALPLGVNSGKKLSNSRIRKEESIGCHYSKPKCMTRLVTISNGLYTASFYATSVSPISLQINFFQLLLSKINLLARRRSSPGIKGTNVLYPKSKLVSPPSWNNGLLNNNQGKKKIYINK